MICSPSTGAGSRTSSWFASKRFWRATRAAQQTNTSVSGVESANVVIMNFRRDLGMRRPPSLSLAWTAEIDGSIRSSRTWSHTLFVFLACFFMCSKNKKSPFFRMSAIVTEGVFIPVAQSMLHERQFHVLIEQTRAARSKRRSYSEKNSISHKELKVTSSSKDLVKKH